MAEIFDLNLHRASLRVLDDLLERRGLGYFLEKGAPFPFSLSERRLALAMELAVRRAGTEPIPDALASTRRMLRRRLIALVAEAMVRVGY